MKLKYNKTLLGLIFLSLVSIFGSLVYRVYSLNNVGVVISLILAIISFFIILRLNNIHNKEKNPVHISNSSATPAYSNNLVKEAITDNKNNLPDKQESKKIELKTKLFKALYVMCYALCVIFCFYILFQNRIDYSITSPWQVIPKYFFIIYALATAILAIIILKNKVAFRAQDIISLISIHYFLSFGIALIIYKIGYGFDPFIHQATVDLINKNGFVEPKPFYYLGQYSLIIVIHKLTFIPLIWLDKLLVPLSAALILPLTLLIALKKLFNNNKAILLSILAFLALPFSFFILTVPQNFSYFLLITVILLGIKCENRFDLAIVYILSLAAMASHPIAGLPAIALAVILTIYLRSKEKLKKYFYFLIAFLSIIFLPLAFYFMEKNGSGDAVAEKALTGLAPESSAGLKALLAREENFILNFIYLLAHNGKLIIITIAAAGVIIALRKKTQYKQFFIYLLLSTSFFVSYLLTKKLPFSFLINYERENYSERILTVSIIFLLPFILIAIYEIIKKIISAEKFIRWPFFIFTVFLITASLYLSYPRFDNYFNSRGLSTGQADLKAVRWIEENSNNDYIVLANQQVSAAALKEFGFKKYYAPKSEIQDQKSEIFYYPVPTGGELYQYYLDMVYKKPSRETMLKAMDLTGAKEGYFVLNSYWWAFPKVLEEAKLEADAWKEIGNGEVYVFTYKK